MDKALTPVDDGRTGTCALETLDYIQKSRTLTRLDQIAHAIWQDWGVGRLSDGDAQRLAEAVEARRKMIRSQDITRVRAPDVPRDRPMIRSPEKPARSYDRKKSWERRRRLAASGPMPPAMACHFTTGELATLKIVADEIALREKCTLTIGEIAARAGVSINTARNGLRYAARLGFLTIEERRRHQRPNLPNVIRIISREWSAWITRGTRSRLQTIKPSLEGGSKKPESTDNQRYRERDFHAHHDPQHRVAYRRQQAFREKGRA